MIPSCAGRAFTAAAIESGDGEQEDKAAAAEMSPGFEKVAI